MNDNKLILKSIDEILKDDFFIPDYQRGYRWSPTQVLALLDDIWKFRADSQDAKNESFYCLQPIVIAAGEKGWIVIDGQQRLTTIHLILTYLANFMQHRERINFGLAYETRPGSQGYLNKPIQNESNDNVDYYHIYEAYIAIENWFKSKSGNAPLNFITTLLNSDEEGKNVRVIWYEVGENEFSNHIDIFTRLNIGKIPLTNSELIKALFLQKGNFDEAKASLKQIQIASEWDYIERTLQQDEFWYFIYNTNNPIKYENRIEYIFDIMFKRNREDENYYTFFEFIKLAEESKNRTGSIDIDALWLRVKQYFLTFEEWFQNRELYHLIGYLVSCGVSINLLKYANTDRNKNEFKDHLYNLIQKEVNFDLNELEYGNSKENDKIRKILLLFNIQTLLINKGADIRFPFHRYKIEKWDIEHIRSQTEKQIAGNYRKDWINDIVEYFTGKKTEDLLNEYENNGSGDAKVESEEMETINPLLFRLIEMFKNDTIEDQSFDLLRQDVEIFFKERVPAEGPKENENVDSIGNLALLDGTTNRSYKNALFPIKRKQIIENDRYGKFVPICTKNVFLKFYSNQLGDVMYWRNSDANNYSNAIKETLKDFLPSENLINGNN
jgi:hypothetical protein